MIKSVKIENFRCFHSTEAKGFTRINLLGGRNNAGKTALLEALWLMTEPSNEKISQLLRFRNINSNFIKQVPGRVWDNFFFQQKKDIEIGFQFRMLDEKNNNVSIFCDESVDDFIEMINNDKDDDSEEMNAFVKSLTNNEVVKSSLHISSLIDDQTIQKNIYVVSSKGSVRKGFAHKYITSNFVPASLKLSNEQLSIEFDKAKFDGCKDLLLKAFKIIDDTITDVDTYNFGEPSLYLTRPSESPMQISLFGDAMNKIADYILKIVNNRDSILLIDEIENGIHHENQEEIWKLLFELCEKYNVQLFATTHSAEMIKAFTNVILTRDNDGASSYFEMTRKLNSNQIVMQKIPVYALADRLKENKPVRGE